MNRREGFVISYVKLSYTGEMEKALQSAHGIGYETYRRNLDVRIRVEKRREQEYLLSRRIVADLERRVYK